MSPKRCRLIHMVVEVSFEEASTVDGDHRITEESVDEDSRVAVDDDDVAGRQLREVTPAS